MTVVHYSKVAHYRLNLPAFFEWLLGDEVREFFKKLIRSLIWGRVIAVEDFFMLLINTLQVG